MPTVLPRARHRKSSAAVKCPTCGSTLIVEKDTPDETVLRCPRCSRQAVAVWLGSADGYSTIRKLAKKYRGLAACDLDDVVSEIVLWVMEHPCPAVPGGDHFCEWLDMMAKQTAGSLRDSVLSERAVASGDAAEQFVQPDGDDGDPPFEMAADMRRFLDARKRRVGRVLTKLPPAQREAVHQRYFGGGNLAAVSRSQGQCDSAVRTNLYRAMKKLVSLLTPDGYSLSA